MSSYFHEVRFPLSIGAGSTFGPSYSTDIVQMPNGAEQRNVNWQYPRCSGSVSLGVKEEGEFYKLLVFFHNRCGKAYGFRFYDYFDHTGDREYLGRGDGTNKVFQLRKYYIDEELWIAKERKILKPIEGTVHVYFVPIGEKDILSWQRALEIRKQKEGTEQNLNWSVDITTGVVTFTEAPPANTLVMASFEFDVPVRFDTDSMPASWELVQAAGWTDIPLIELKF